MEPLIWGGLKSIVPGPGQLISDLPEGIDTLPLGQLSSLGRGIARDVARAAAVSLAPAFD